MVATPPEIAEAYEVAPALTQVPRGDDQLGTAGATATNLRKKRWPQRADVLYVGHDGHAEGRSAASRCAPEQIAASDASAASPTASSRTSGQVILMNGPMYHSAPNSYGMLAFRSRCTIVLEPRFDPSGYAAAHRASSRHSYAHGADDVRGGLAAVARRDQTRLTTSPRQPVTAPRPARQSSAR